MAGAGHRDRRRGPAVSWPIVGAVDRKLPSSGHRRPTLFIGISLVELLLRAMDGTKYGTYPETSSLLGFNSISTSCTGLPARILPSAGLDDSTNSRVAMLSSRWAWKQGADGGCATRTDTCMYHRTVQSLPPARAGFTSRLFAWSCQPRGHNKLMKLWCSSGVQWGLTWTSLPLVGPSAHGSEAIISVSDASTDSLEYGPVSRVCSAVFNSSPVHPQLSPTTSMANEESFDLRPAPSTAPRNQLNGKRYN